MGQNPRGRPTHTVCVACVAQRQQGAAWPSTTHSAACGQPMSLPTWRTGHAQHLLWRSGGVQSTRRDADGDDWSTGRCSRGHPWITVQRRGKVLSSGSCWKQGTVVGWWLTGAAEARCPPSEEGGDPVAQEAALLLGGAFVTYTKKEGRSGALPTESGDDPKQRSGCGLTSGREAAGHRQYARGVLL
jgi:hypothetical protein